jgi:RimJ/RimL family protein N-acetyltransferase
MTGRGTPSAGPTEAPAAPPGPDPLARTERLVVRRFRPTDGPGLHAILSRPEAVRFEPYGVQDAAACERIARDRAADPRFWAVERAADGVLLGTLYLAPAEDPAWATYEVGFVFHPDHWGRGYATEAARALLDHVFGDLGAHRVLAHCDPRNAASWRLLERLGMRREGLHRRAASFAADDAGRPVWHDVAVYAVLAEEWARDPRA